MVTTVRSLGLNGIAGYEVTAECFLSGGLPAFDIVGLPDAAVREARERVRAAVKNCGAKFPVSRITVNLAPAGTKKAGTVYDLPIFVGLLAADGDLPAPPTDAAFIGELSLTGALRGVSGVLPMALAAREAGIRTLYVPADNAAEATLAEGLTVYGVPDVGALVAHLKNETPLSPAPVWVPEPEETGLPDLQDVMGQEHVKRALEIAAAGGHNLLLIGSPGVGKSMLAKRLPGILPPLSYEEALETTAIYSVAGLVQAGTGLLQQRPFRSPHHSVSAAAIAGGGTVPRPGEVSLAHNGVLFLDELPEFSREALEVLRQPLEDGSVTIARAGQSLTYPAACMLVAAMNPCPCGNYGSADKPCTCTPAQIHKYRAKISGPLLDRIDIQVEVDSVKYDDLAGDDLEESSVSTTRFASVHVKQEAGSNVLVNGITLNNGLTRNNYYIELNGEQAEATLCGMSILDKEQQLDTYSHITHAVPYCTSNELFKNVLDDHAVGAFSGRILVKEDAQKTAAYQTNRNLCATREARMYSKPQLEIYADDVKCSHGATVGQLDENALFYMRSRGINEKEARLLLMFAFVNEVIDTIRLDALKDRLHLLVEKRFRGELNRCQGCAICK